MRPCQYAEGALAVDLHEVSEKLTTSYNYVVDLVPGKVEKASNYLSSDGKLMWHLRWRNLGE